MAQIKKDTSLRKSILQAAIAGQLISSCHSEQQPCHSELDSESAETGKELLDKIIEERNKKLLAEWEEALKKNQKAKKPAPVVASEIDEEEIPFDIPENWCWCRLGDLINISSGDMLTSTAMKNGSVPVYGGNGITGYHNVANVHEETIVIGRVGFYCGSVHLTEREAWVTDNAFITTYSKTFLNREFLITALRHLDLGKQQNKTAQPVVSGKKIYPMLFPLPPLAVQNAIVAKLEQVLPLVDAYENAILQKEELKSSLPDKVKKAILQEAITGKLTENWRKIRAVVEPVETTESGKQLLDRIIAERNNKLIAEWEEAKKTNPKANKPAPIVASLQYDQDGRLLSEVEAPFEIPGNWCWCRLGDLVTILGDGLHGTPKFDGSGEYYFVNGNNLNNGVIEIKPDTKKVNKTEFEKYKKELNDSTIFVSINGTIGNIAFYNNEKIILGKSACYFNVAIQELKKYFFYLFQTDFFLTYAIDNATGTTIKNVGLGTMRNFLLPLPPLAEQEEIVRKVEELLAECTGLGK